MKLTRRSFLAMAALTGGAALGGPWVWRMANADEPQELPIPELMDARALGQSIELKAQAGEASFFPGRSSKTLGYNGSYLGPTIRVHKGDDVEVAVTNTLAEDTTVHWHGLLIPGELDGGPHQLVRPGATWRPVLPIRQSAATLWYHSHVHGRTAEQVYAGLAGLLIVSDEQEKNLQLPSQYGVDDLPLILQDRQFEEGTLVLPQGMMATMHGRRGDTLLANGVPNPVARVPRRLVRLRLVNGSNARTFDLAFDDERAFHWIASEGGLLNRPVELRSLTLTPGERAEIIVDFSDGRPVKLETGPDTSVPMMMGMMAQASNAIGVGRGTLVNFAPEGERGVEVNLPAHLGPQEWAKASDSVRRRQFTMNMGMGMMGGMMGSRGGMGGMMRGGSAMFGINGRAYDMARIDEEVRLGDVEIWEVHSEMMAHPFHVHGVHFQVLRRNGGDPHPRDQGLKDTVLVDESVELLVRFTQPATKAPFMYHCHILEHEDNGMMGQFLVA